MVPSVTLKDGCNPEKSAGQVLLLEGTSMRFPHFSIEILMAVVVTAEKKSVTRAGKELGLSPSGVTKRLKIAERIAKTPCANYLRNRWLLVFLRVIPSAPNTQFIRKT